MMRIAYIIYSAVNGSKMNSRASSAAGPLPAETAPWPRAGGWLRRLPHGLQNSTVNVLPQPAMLSKLHAQGRKGIGQDGTALLDGDERLTVDHAAARVLAYLRGRGLAGFEVAVKARRCRAKRFHPGAF